MKAYDLARQEIGVMEWKDGHNPTVLTYFKDAGHAWVKDDETAWCAAFVGAMLRRAGMKSTGELTARSYLNWGLPVDLADARPGDLVVFKRGASSWQGHVGFFVRQTPTQIIVLGGNQGNRVSEAACSKASLLGVRRAATEIAPTTVDDRKPAAPAVNGFWAALGKYLATIFHRKGKTDDGLR